MTGIERLRMLAEIHRGNGRMFMANYLSGIADQIEREHADDREAIAWVREHGGVDELTRMFQDADNRRVELCAALGIDLDKGWSEAMAAMRPRLMPEGMEWPTVDGRKVDFKTQYQPSLGVLEAVSIYSNGACEVMSHDGIIKPVSEIHVVVLAADGKPLREGETVWYVKTGEELFVSTFTGGLVNVSDKKGGGLLLLPSQLTHQRPVLDADGVPIREGDTVWLTDGSEGHVVLSTDEDAIGNIVTETQAPGLVRVHISPRRLTHQRPDSWERIEEDAGCTATKYNERRGTIFTTKQQVARDLVRRCRALAERERGE